MFNTDIHSCTAFDHIFVLHAIEQYNRVPYLVNMRSAYYDTDQLVVYCLTYGKN